MPLQGLTAHLGLPQAEALRLALDKKGKTAKVYVAMRYWKPFTEDTLEDIKRDRYAAKRRARCDARAAPCLGSAKAALSRFAASSFSTQLNPLPPL